MERRRLLENVPFKENLVFYAPLIMNDTSEILNNTSPIIGSGCVVEYVPAKDIFRLRCNSGNNQALLYQNLNMGLSIGQEITMVIDVEELSMYDQWQSMFSTPRYNQGTNAYLRHDRYVNSTLLLSGRFCVTYTYRSSTTQNANFYKDGEFIKSIVFPNPRIDSNVVTICETANGSGRFYDFYVSNARIYNRALTNDEIIKL